MRRDLLIRRLRRFLGNKRAATAIEYAIIAGGVAAVLAGTIAVLGGKVLALWTAVKSAFN